MNFTAIVKNCLFGALFISIAAPSLADTTFVKFGSSWKYLDNGSDQGTAWRAPAFNDAAWASGPAQLGYGDGNERTVTGYGPSAANKYITTYFRTTVTIANPALFTSFTINAYADDGMVVYVNGQPVATSNISPEPSYTTPATAVAADNGHSILSFKDIPATAFTAGVNSIAVEIHQSDAASPDLVFDLELIGAGNPAEAIIHRGPLLQMLSTDAISVKWQTISATGSRVIYGTSPDDLRFTIASDSMARDHELRITGLTPDTKYYYAFGSTTSIQQGSYRNCFTTAPLPGTTRKIRIGVFGDPGTGNAVQKAVRDAYIHLNKNGGKADLALFLGDNAYDGGYDVEHQAKFFHIYQDNIFKDHPVFSVPGNHEYDNDPKGVAGLRGNHLIPYYQIFSLPTAAECGGIPSGTEHYYSFDYGNVHFIMLDSYGYDSSKLLYDSTGAQANWLKADLAAYAHKLKWTIVCLHHPPYTHGTHNSETEKDLVAIRQQITPILERFGVDVVLAGHSHVYERSWLIQGHTGGQASFIASRPPSGNQVSNSSARYDGTTNSCPYFTIDSAYNHGTVYIVAGSAGQVGGNANAQFPLFYYKNYSGSTDGEGGALYLEIEDNRLEAKFVGASGNVHDRFIIMKGVNQKTIVRSPLNTPATLQASWVGSYNWYAASKKTVSLGNSRSLEVKPTAKGTYIYYANDSLRPKTCMADTFTVVVTSPLVLSVSRYDALVKNDKALVQWNTTQEINSDYFTIERSANGKDYEMIMMVKGAGNSATPLSYEFQDSKPLPGTNYYRLSATDANGDDKVVGVCAIQWKN